jgi:hypothetical protein
MPKPLQMKTLLALILLGSMILLATGVALAQEATAAPTSATVGGETVQQAAGLSVGVLFLGVLAVLAVGGVFFLRERFKGEITN